MHTFPKYHNKKESTKSCCKPQASSNLKLTGTSGEQLKRTADGKTCCICSVAEWQSRQNQKYTSHQCIHFPRINTKKKVHKAAMSHRFPAIPNLLEQVERCSNKLQMAKLAASGQLLSGKVDTTRSKHHINVCVFQVSQHKRKYTKLP